MHSLFVTLEKNALNTLPVTDGSSDRVSYRFSLKRKIKLKYMQSKCQMHDSYNLMQEL